MASNKGKTVAQILKWKRGGIKNAPLEPDSPSWDDILALTWEEIDENAANDEPGFRTFKKLLEQKRFDKPKRPKK